MKKIISLVSFFILLGIMVSTSYGYFPYPSYSGASGLVRIPDASVLPYKNWSLAADFGTQTTSTGNQPSFAYKAAMGAFRNFEIGFVGGLDSTGTAVRDGAYINLKYAPTVDEGKDPLLLAIGIENLASKSQTALYMVATKPLKQGPRLSFGFSADFPQGKFRPLGMAGLDIPVGSISFLVDMFAGESVLQLNGGVRFIILPDFVLEGRAINILQNNSTAAKDNQQFLGGFSWINPF